MTGASADREGEVARALARASIYRLLAAAFAAPSPCAIETLPEAAERAASTASPEIAAKLVEWAAAARATAPGELARAYVAVLERPAGCSPYEGSYGAAPRLAGKGTALADIAGFYAAFGVTPRIAEVEDHIAAELEFMSVLVLKEAVALAAGESDHAEVTQAAEVTFLRDHLGLWGGSFAEALCALDPVPYLAQAAALLGAWLAEDMKRLGVDVAALGAGQTVDPDGAEPFSCPMAAHGITAAPLPVGEARA